MRHQKVVLALLLVIVSITSSSLAQRSERSARKTLIIAHRGGAHEFTENTIEAFQRAISLGADGIETDLRLTRDGVVVLYHDERFGRVEGLSERHRTRLISEMTWRELSAGTLQPAGEDRGSPKVARLEDLLSSVKTGLLNIELKRGDRFDQTVDRVIELLSRYPDQPRVVLEPPDLRTARKLRKELPAVKLHINPASNGAIAFADSLKEVLEFRPHSISVSHKRVSIELIEAAHEAGVEVWAWTVDSPDIASAMIVLGVDAIKTDVPKALLDLRSRLRPDSRKVG